MSYQPPVRITHTVDGKEGSVRNEENTRILIADKEPLFLDGLRAGIEGSLRWTPEFGPVGKL